jgi:hypothetical protein
VIGGGGHRVLLGFYYVSLPTFQLTFVFNFLFFDVLYSSMKKERSFVTTPFSSTKTTLSWN